jgi:hypothetical protein
MCSINPGVMTNSITEYQITMTEGWPPEGYSTPTEYVSSDRLIVAIGVALVLPAVLFTHTKISMGTVYFIRWIEKALTNIGIHSRPLLLLFAAFLASVCWILVSAIVVITVHESIHYTLAKIFNINPRFEFNWQLNVPNPSVVAYHQGINRRENIAMLIAPFSILSLVCGIGMLVTSGVVSGTFAIMFAVNAVPSCGDLYHVGRIVKMPPGTLFANFEEEDALRTEVSTPESA